jgi:nucleotide-binding universal stress UspA family protein
MASVEDSHRGKPILVAYDGSRSARTAALWAVDEAAGSGRPLTLAHVIRWPLPEVDVLHLAGAAHDPDRARQQATDLVNTAVGWCRQRAPAVDIRGEVLTGGAIDLLTKLSSDAAMLVLGTAGQTAGPQVLLGASASELARRVTVPLAVIRDVPAGSRPTAVVVGVDGSPAGARAAQVGFDVAARRRLRVVAVHAWSDLPAEAVGIRADLDDVQGYEEGTELLEAQLAELRGRYPQVPVEEVVAVDRPAGALLGRAADAALLVVGRHGRAGIDETPLGSVCHAVLHYAPCSVLVVR